MKKRRSLFWKLALVLAGGAALAIGAVLREPAPSEILNAWGGEITVFKSPACGCCSQYVRYLQVRTTIPIKTVSTPNLDRHKGAWDIPKKLQSCHTSKVGNYFVEGHVPIAAIAKLLRARPDIKGISLPGMPPGAAGMAGTRQWPATVYAVRDNGRAEEFFRF